MHNNDQQDIDRLISIWKETLGVASVNIDDSFFSLGGDSMRVIRMLVQVSQEFGKDLDIDSFFNTPTLGSLQALLFSPSDT
jgi:acyl carrier protein